jgi:hypothetical protein
MTVSGSVAAVSAIDKMSNSGDRSQRRYDVYLFLIGMMLLSELARREALTSPTRSRVPS